MPVFPWRFVDSLLGRSRLGDEEPATADYVSAEVARLTARLEADSSTTARLDASAPPLLSSWAAEMLRRCAPSPDGRSRRDVNVQLGAVSGAIRAVIQTIDEALTNPEDATAPRLSWRLRRLESEMAAPLYTRDEQPLVRARLDRILEQLESSDAPEDLTDLIPRILQALTPPGS